jgi:hypothetical protein
MGEMHTVVLDAKEIRSLCNDLAMAVRLDQLHVGRLEIGNRVADFLHAPGPYSHLPFLDQQFPIGMIGLVLLDMRADAEVEAAATQDNHYHHQGREYPRCAGRQGPRDSG